MSTIDRDTVEPVEEAGPVQHDNDGLPAESQAAAQGKQSARLNDADEDEVDPASSKPTSTRPADDAFQPEAESAEEGDDEEDDLYPEPEEDEDLLPPPDFHPFFTLVEEGSGEQHQHPTVHYIFADDDPDILTDAALDTLSTAAPNPLLDYHIPDQRFVIVDLSADGKEVVSSSSLSPDWQAVHAKISPAPSWGGDNGRSTERGLMLTIRGQEAKRENTPKGRNGRGETEGLLRAFEEQLRNLDGVLGTSDEIVDTQTAQQPQQDLAK